MKAYDLSLSHAVRVTAPSSEGALGAPAPVLKNEVHTEEMHYGKIKKL